MLRHQRGSGRLWAAAIILLVSIAGLTAEEQTLPDRWHGMVIDESTPEDAIRLFGPPEKDELDRLTVFYIRKWITAKQKEHVFRVLKYTTIKDYDRVYLTFLENHLVYIRLDIDGKIPAAAIAKICGIPFTPKFDAGDLVMSPQDFQHDQGKIYPKRWPETYTLIATADRTFLTAYVDNVSVGAMFGMQDLDAPSGNVKQVQIVSRALENRDGADLLK